MLGNVSNNYNFKTTHLRLDNEWKCIYEILFLTTSTLMQSQSGIAASNHTTPQLIVKEVAWETICRRTVLPRTQPNSNAVITG